MESIFSSASTLIQECTEYQEAGPHFPLNYLASHSQRTFPWKAFYSSSIFHSERCTFCVGTIFGELSSRTTSNLEGGNQRCFAAAAWTSFESNPSSSQIRDPRSRTVLSVHCHPSAPHRLHRSEDKTAKMQNVATPPSPFGIPSSPWEPQGAAAKMGK